MARTLLLAGCATCAAMSGVDAMAATPEEVVAFYAEMAHAKYEDSLDAAMALHTSISAFLEAPSETTMADAKTAWLNSRVPHQQTEVFRFGNVLVDEWEGKVNAWPLDEGLINYVDADYGDESDENLFYTANIVANPKLAIGGQEVDASEITPELLQSLHEINEVEANVATGYHAIEFLRWGQDLNGTDPGAGERQWTDYASGNTCTNDNCDRRGTYLRAATHLLVMDLEEMTAAWTGGGAARHDLLGESPELGRYQQPPEQSSPRYRQHDRQRTRSGRWL